jgi:hypothetical protein
MYLRHSIADRSDLNGQDVALKICNVNNIHTTKVSKVVRA